MISGFGKFDVKDKTQRRGRNPTTDVEAFIEGRRVVRFKWSGRLRERINKKG